jgi:hypothetical protein
MTGLQVHRHRIANRLLRRWRGRRRARSERRRGRERHGHVPSAATVSLLDAGQISGRARAERASKQLKELGFRQLALELMKSFSLGSVFYRSRAAPRELNSPTVTHLINGHISKTPVGPLQARAAFSPSYGILQHQLTYSNWSLIGQMLA